MMIIIIIIIIIITGNKPVTRDDDDDDNNNNLIRVYLRTNLRAQRPKIIIITHGAEPFFRSCQLCTYLRTSQK
jgi:hypothetical protein